MIRLVTLAAALSASLGASPLTAQPKRSVAAAPVPAAAAPLAAPPPLTTLPAVAPEPPAAPYLFLIVNEKVPVDALTVSQVRDIYLGKTTLWPQGSPVRVFGRPLDAGVGTM